MNCCDVIFVFSYISRCSPVSEMSLSLCLHSPWLFTITGRSGSVKTADIVVLCLLVLHISLERMRTTLCQYADVLMQVQINHFLPNWSPDDFKDDDCCLVWWLLTFTEPMFGVLHSSRQIGDRFYTVKETFILFLFFPFKTNLSSSRIKSQ